MFYRVNMLDGVMEEFLGKLNSNCGPLREQVLTIDLLSMWFMIIGLVSVTILATVIGYMWSFGYSAGLLFIFILVLLYFLRRNQAKTKVLMQSFILNMAIIIYMENQTVFFKRGIRA